MKLAGSFEHHPRLASYQYFFTCLTCLLLASRSVRAQEFSLSLPNNLAENESAYHRTWQIGGFAMGGWPPNYQIHGILNYQEEVHQYAASFEAGRILTKTHGSGLARGRSEAVVEITPFWISHEPYQIDQIYCCGNSGPFLGGTPGGYYHGVTVVPLLLRWNFMKRDSSRLVPWVQGGVGVLWTNKDYPQYPKGTSASRFNFTPQFGVGESFFVRKNQSIDIGARFVHATSWGLGEYNPGVSSLQFTAGYSWWK